MSYSELPELGRAIAYFVFRKKETNYESIRKRFERFDEKLVKIALEEATSQETPFINFDSRRNTYRPSEHLLNTYRILNMV